MSARRKNAVWVLHDDEQRQGEPGHGVCSGERLQGPQRRVLFARRYVVRRRTQPHPVVHESGQRDTGREGDRPAGPTDSLVGDEAYNHGARMYASDRDGKLYSTVGQRYNVLPPEKYEAYYKAGMGAIVRYNQDGSGREIYAHGIRNSVGMDFNPKDKTLWFTDNQTDTLRRRSSAERAGSRHEGR